MSRKPQLGIVQRTVQLILIAGLCAASSPARAAFASPSQWQRGIDPDSTYQEWDRFASTAGPNPPNSPGVPLGADVNAPPFNPNGIANVAETTGGSFLTGGGNIYSPFIATQFDATVPNYNAGAAAWTTLLVQLRTQGSSIDVNSLQVTSAGTVYSPAVSSLLFTQPLGGPGGALEDRWFQFLLPGNVASYLVEFQAASESMSLDKLSIDTVWTAGREPIIEPNPVPEPGAVGLLAAGLATLVMACGRMKRPSRESAGHKR